jgi:hypothetical protein
MIHHFLGVHPVVFCCILFSESGSQLQEIATLRKVNFTTGGCPCDEFTAMRQAPALDLADAGSPNK